MENKLLLLGLLLSHDMHGYQLNEYLQSNPGLPITLKKSNAYRLLSEMEKDGWITHIEDQEGNRPPRRVYSVTEAGKAAFDALLRENLAAHLPPEFPGAVGLDFLHNLPREEAADLLALRRQAVEKQFQELDSYSDEIMQSHLTLGYLHRHYALELDWLEEVIEHLGRKSAE